MSAEVKGGVGGEYPLCADALNCDALMIRIWVMMGWAQSPERADRRGPRTRPQRMRAGMAKVPMQLRNSSSFNG